MGSSSGGGAGAARLSSKAGCRPLPMAGAPPAQSGAAGLLGSPRSVSGGGTAGAGMGTGPRSDSFPPQNSGLACGRGPWMRSGSRASSTRMESSEDKSSAMSDSDWSLWVGENSTPMGEPGAGLCCPAGPAGSRPAAGAVPCSVSRAANPGPRSVLRGGLGAGAPGPAGAGCSRAAGGAAGAGCSRAAGGAAACSAARATRGCCWRSRARCLRPLLLLGLGRAVSRPGISL